MKISPHFIHLEESSKDDLRKGKYQTKERVEEPKPFKCFDYFHISKQMRRFKWNLFLTELHFSNVDISPLIISYQEKKSFERSKMNLFVSEKLRRRNAKLN